VFAECLAVGLACGDQRRLTGSGSALEAIKRNALYKSTFTLRTALLLCCVANGSSDELLWNPELLRDDFGMFVSFAMSEFLLGVEDLAH